MTREQSSTASALYFLKGDSAASLGHPEARKGTYEDTEGLLYPAPLMLPLVLVYPSPPSGKTSRGGSDNSLKWVLSHRSGCMPREG